MSNPETIEYSEISPEDNKKATRAELRARIVELKSLLPEPPITSEDTQPISVVTSEKKATRNRNLGCAVLGVLAVGVTAIAVRGCAQDTNSVDPEAIKPSNTPDTPLVMSELLSTQTQAAVIAATHGFTLPPTATLTGYDSEPENVLVSTTQEVVPMGPEPELWEKPISVIDPVIEGGVQEYTLSYFGDIEAVRVVCVWDGTCNIGSNALSQEDLDALAIAYDHVEKSYGKTSKTVGALEMVNDGIYYQVNLLGKTFTSTTPIHAEIHLADGSILYILKTLGSDNSPYGQTAYNRAQRRPYRGSRSLVEGEAMFVAIPLVNGTFDYSKGRLIAGACANPAGQELVQFKRDYVAPEPQKTPVRPIAVTPVSPVEPTPVPPNPTATPQKPPEKSPPGDGVNTDGQKDGARGTGQGTGDAGGSH